MTRYFASAACVTALLLNVACATVTCSSDDFGPDLIRVAHLSGGGAPVIELLEVSQGGEARLEKVGFRTYCGSVPREALQSLRAIVKRTSLGKIAWSPGTGLHAEEAHVFLDDVEVRVVLGDLPGELVPLFQALDEIFIEVFGRRYDMPLLLE